MQPQPIPVAPPGGQPMYQQQQPMMYQGQPGMYQQPGQPMMMMQNNGMYQQQPQMMGQPGGMMMGQPGAMMMGQPQMMQQPIQQPMGQPMYQQPPMQQKPPPVPQLPPIDKSKDIELKRGRSKKGSEIMVTCKWKAPNGQPQLGLSVMCMTATSLFVDGCNGATPIVMSGAIRHELNMGNVGKVDWNEAILVDVEALDLYTPVNVLAFIINCPFANVPHPYSQSNVDLEIGVNEVLKGKEVKDNKAEFIGKTTSTVQQSTGTTAMLLGMIYKDVNPKNNKDGKSQWYLRKCGAIYGAPGPDYMSNLPLVHECLKTQGLALPPANYMLNPSQPMQQPMNKGDIIYIPAHYCMVPVVPTVMMQGAPPPPPDAGLRLTVGLGWKVLKGGSVDLDSSILMFDNADNLLEIVNFGHLQGGGGAIQHRGDNQVGGDGAGDLELIDVYLNMLPPNVSQFFIVVNVYSEGQMFSSVNPSYVRLLGSSGEQLLRYELDASVKAPCLIFAKVFRSPKTGGWMFNTVGVGCQGRVANEDSVRAGCLGSAITYGPAKQQDKKKRQYPAVGLGLAAGAAIITVGATAALLAGAGPSFETIGGVFADGGEVIGEGVMWAGSGIGSAFETMGDGIGDAAGWIGDNAPAAFEAVGDAAGNAVGWIGDNAPGAVEAVGDAAGNAVEFVGDQDWGAHAGTVAAGAGTAVAAVGGAAESAGDAAAGCCENCDLDKITECFDPIMNEVKKLF